MQHNLQLFSADIWDQTYESMRQKVEDFELRRHISLTAITPAIEAFVGKTPPNIIGMAREDLIVSLTNKSIDIAFCGLVFDSSVLGAFVDATSPPYLVTGHQIVANYLSTSPAIVQLLLSLFATIDSQAVLILYISSFSQSFLGS